jgi:DNA-binding MarR family transcriptional regulator
MRRHSTQVARSACLIATPNDIYPMTAKTRTSGRSNRGRSSDEHAADSRKVVLRLQEFLPYRLNFLAAAISQSLIPIYRDPFGLGRAEWRTLMAIGQHQVMTVTEVGLHSQMLKLRVSRAAAELESQKLIVRRDNPADLRESLLSLSRKGRAIYERLVRDSQAFAARIEAAIAPADRVAFERTIVSLEKYCAATRPQWKQRNDVHMNETGDQFVFELERFLPYRLNILAATVSQSLTPIYRNQYGFERGEWRAVMAIGQYGNITAKEIGLHGQMLKARVSRVVAALESRKLIVRTSQIADLRVSSISLSPMGWAIYERLVRDSVAFNQRVESVISRSDRAAFERCIASLTAFASQYKGDRKQRAERSDVL